MTYAKGIIWNTPGQEIMNFLDRSLLALYAHIRKNYLRLIHLVAVLLPLMALLVGSCETSQLPSMFMAQQSSPEAVRTALFPDRAYHQGANYIPAAGYISRAQTFVVSQPQSLMMLTQQEIGYLFGTPTLHRKDADADVWQYKTNSCVVDFYFYGTPNGRAQSKLSYIDVRTKEELTPGSAPRKAPVSQSEQSDCLHDVMNQDFFTTTHT